MWSTTIWGRTATICAITPPTSPICVKTAWGDAINYDGAYSDGVRQFVLDNARMWLEVYGFDGLRLDAVGAIYSFEAVHLLEELASAVHAFADANNRTIVLIAESDLNDPRLVHSAGARRVWPGCPLG